VSPLKTKFVQAFAIIILTAWLFSDTYAQKIARRLKFKRIDVNAQLSNLNVTAITQDSKGFLWVGTNDGLNRFNGYDFKVYRNIKNDTASLIKNVIQSEFEDSRGVLWVSTLNSGLHYYNRQQDAFYRVNEFSQRHCQVFRIMEDYQHNLWIGGVFNSYAFVATLDHQTNSWKKFQLFQTTEGIYTMLQHSEDEFWLGTRINGLYKWNKKTNELTQYIHDPKNANSLPGNYVEEMAEDIHGNLWLGIRGNGLSKFDSEKNVFKNFSAQVGNRTTMIPNNQILDICIDGNYLWISTENGGLSRMDIDRETFVNFFYDKNDPNSLINSTNWTLYKDKQDRLWIGSYAKGLCVVDPLEEKISGVDIPMENDLVNAIFKDSFGRLWIGTVDGLWLLDKNGTHHFLYDAKSKNSLSSNPVLCIYEDKKHRIWIGLWNGGLDRFDESKRNFIRYQPASDQKEVHTGGNVFSIGESSTTGELIVCTFNGLQILKDEKTGTFEGGFPYSHEGDQLLLTMLEDSKKNIWVGAFSGLSLYDLKKKTIERIPLTADTTEVNDRVNAIFEDSKKRLWIGSDAGLHQKIDNQIVTYTIKDGLPVNVVIGISEDSKGNLWLGTTKGLTVFDPIKKTFVTYDESDGLLSAELRVKSFFEAEDGQFFVGGKGVNTFYPDSLVSNPYMPPVYITDLKIFNQSVKQHDASGILNNDVTNTKEIFLSYKHTFISLQYVAINFTNSFKNQYAYKLENFDEDWNYVGNQRFATYTNLKPGDYTFRVKASNNDGLWNEEGATLVIHVLPPWWDTWFFKIFLFAAFACTVVLIILFRTRNIKRINRELEEAVSQKTEEIKAQNKILTEQREVMAQQNENLEEEVAKRTKELVEYNHQLEQFAFIAAHNLRAPVARILGLGQLLDLTKADSEEREKIYPKLVNTTQELDGVVHDLNTILELKKNNDSFITEVDLNTSVELIRENLEREIMLSQAVVITDFNEVGCIRTVKPYLESILYNLVSNAIKYRHPDRQPLIRIKTKKSETEICLIVNDNGLGIDTSLYKDKLFTLYSRFHDHVEGKGMGLYLVKTQMEALGGRIEIESEQNKGTTFRACFKV
jgi:ligand-binding sensor domain-containing protein/signal transduction histidine kinase